MSRIHLSLATLVVLVIKEVPAAAQYPGQYPGGYPPGQYPPQTGGPGIPFPRRGKKKTADAAKDAESKLKQVTGVIRQIDEKSVLITADDTRNINFKRTGTTKFLKKGEDLKPETLKAGDHVTVEASEDDEGYFTAVRVTLEKEGTAQEREKASTAVQMPAPSIRRDDDDRPILRRNDPPKPAKDDATQDTVPRPVAAPEPAKSTAAAPPPADIREEPERADVPVVESDVPIDASDPGAPRMKRGKPSARRTAQPTKEVAVNTPPKIADRSTSPTAAATAPAAPPAPAREAAAVDRAPRTDPRIEKTRAAVATFTESLPAYVCQEQIARFVNTTVRLNWQPVDVVSAEVVYENHKEQYRNLAINGKPAKKAMEELSGSWSTGEFGTVLVDLFSPATNADFRYRRQAKSGGRDAYLFEFEVDQENSHWHVQVASQSILPAYKGSVWIDKETSQVLRIEMESVKLPSEFPMDKIESATDYQFIRISERQYLLPIHAEVLSCQRGTSNCSRNAIDFRNYHKYSGESSITFENK